MKRAAHATNANLPRAVPLNIGYLARSKSSPVEDVRLGHRMQVIRALRATGGMSRTELSKVLHLSPTTMTKLVSELLELGYVIEFGERVQNGLGRPRQGLQLVRNALRVLSIVVEPRRLSWVEVSLNLELGQQGSIAYPVADRPAIETLNRIAELVRKRARERKAAQGPLYGVTLAVPGFVDDELRISIDAPHIHWKRVPVADHLEEAVNLPVAVYNNARAMALAEFEHLRLEEGDSLLFVQTRQGVGAALVNTTATNQRHHVVTELGNIPLSGLETRSGGSPVRLHSIVNESYLRRSLDFHDEDTEVVVQLERQAAEGQPHAQRLRAQTLRQLAYALSIAIDLLNPRIVVLGGIFAHASDAFIEELMREVKRLAMEELTRNLEIRRSALAGVGAQIGAQMAGIDRFLTTRIF
jgi:predicted NBD/HSP70 family sugar kinase